MTERVLGPTGSPRRRWTLLLPLTLVIVVGLFYITGAQAVHDAGVFELDANATSAAGTGQPNDWDDIFATAPTCPGTTVCRFIHEGENATIFTGGGSKDDLNTTSWEHKAGSVPDKDDMSDAFAARYTVPTYDPDGAGPMPPGSDIVYFGADRIANNGDAALGFWFFQSNIVAQAGGTFGPGQHIDGDLLIISEFTGGGEDVRIAAYRWNGPGGSIAGTGAINGTLDELFPLTDQDCLDVGGNDPMCGTVNDGITGSPWPFTDKAGSTSFRQGEFFEGGVNLTFLGLEDECFTSFLAETRSSTSIDATLKDFVIGQFAPCAASLSTTPSTGAGGSVNPGQPVTDTATVLGAGLSNPPTPTGSVSFFLCGPIATGVCSTGGTPVSTNALAASAPPPGEAQATSGQVNTVASPLAPGRYCFRAEWPGDTNYPGALSHTGTGNSECFNVNDTTTTSTRQNWRPNDSATVTATAGSALAGSVAFTLYASANCTGTVLYTETVPVSGASPQVAVTTNDGTAVTDVLIDAVGATTVSWSAVFTSTNGNVGGSTGPCESTTVTIDNDITTP